MFSAKSSRAQPGRSRRARRWLPAMSTAELTSAVHDNLRNLGLEAMDIVNLSIMGSADGHGPSGGSIAEPLSTMVDLHKQGLVRHIGLSTVTPTQIAEARGMAEIVCVQNLYNLAHREDDAMVSTLAQAGITYVPYFPPGRFHTAAIRRLIGSRGRTGGDADAGGTGLAAATLAQPVANPWHLVGRTSEGKPEGGRPCAVGGGRGGAGSDWRGLRLRER
ncbi:MAG: aldo/keto reductase [Brevundimonas sp.]